MKRMTKNGAFMDVYTLHEQERAAKRGWKVVPEKKKKVKKE